MNNNAIPEHLRRLEALAKKRKEIENCIQAMEYASDLYDVETYLQYRERYKELTGYYPGKDLLNNKYGINSVWREYLAAIRIERMITMKIELELPSGTLGLFVSFIVANEDGIEMGSECITCKDLMDAENKGGVISYAKD